MQAGIRLHINFLTGGESDPSENSGQGFVSRKAERVRFELTRGCPQQVFETCALNHSATSPLFLSASRRINQKTVWPRVPGFLLKTPPTFRRSHLATSPL